MLDKTDKLPRSSSQTASPTEKYPPSNGSRKAGRGFCNEYPEEHWEKWPKQIYEERIEYEWSILKTKGVIDYFVLVGDVVRWAKITRASGSAWDEAPPQVA